MRRPVRSGYPCFAILLPIFLAAGLLADAPATQPARGDDPDLVACWRGDSVNGGVAVDFSNHHHDARAASGDKVVMEAVGGRTAFRFNKGAGHLDAGAVPEFNFTADFTFAFFVRLADNSGNVGLIQKLGKTDGFAIDSDVSNNWGIVFTGSPRAIPTTSRPLPNDWYHVAITFSNNHYLLYIDGRAIGALADQAMPPANNLHLTFGAAGAEGVAAMDGWMDDIRIYHRALKIEEIRLLKSDKPLANPYAPMTSQEQENIRNLVRSMGSLVFEEREAAHKQLKAIGRKAFPVLREFRHDNDAEVRLRACDLLGELPAIAAPPPQAAQPNAAPIDLSDFIFPLPAPD